METLRQRLEQDLNTAIGRVRHLGGSVTVEELPGPIGINGPFADEVDEMQARQRREIGCATGELLAGRVNRLSAGLDRLANGEYGTCAECGEAISLARLRAVPDAQTCVRCKDRIERLGHRFAREATAFQFEDG